MIDGGHTMPEISGKTEVFPGTLQEIANDEKCFCNFVTQFFRYSAWTSIGCEPLINPARLTDAHLAYKEDKERMKRNLPSASEPDHFKLAGILVFWLRRFAPVYTLTLKKQATYDAAGRDFQNAMKRFSSEVMAFDMGLHICDVYNNAGKPKAESLSPDIGVDYYAYVGYMLKFKNMSPHALATIYKSLYIPLIKR